MLRPQPLNSTGTITSHLYAACPFGASSQLDSNLCSTQRSKCSFLPGHGDDAGEPPGSGRKAARTLGSAQEPLLAVLPPAPRSECRSQPPAPADLRQQRGGFAGLRLAAAADSCRYSARRLAGTRSCSDVIPAEGGMLGEDAAAEAGSEMSCVPLPPPRWIPRSARICIICHRAAGPPPLLPAPNAGGKCLFQLPVLHLEPAAESLGARQSWQSHFSGRRMLVPPVPPITSHCLQALKKEA